MALINCPYCGEKISDTAKSCVHCGHPLGSAALEKQTVTKEVAPKDKDRKMTPYSSLSEEDRLRLDRKFFYEVHKDYGKNLDTLNSVDGCRATIAAVGGFSLIALVVLVFAFSRDLITIYNLIFCCAVAIIALNILLELIFVVVFSVKLYGLYNKKIEALKEYCDWLAKQKIEFIPTFLSSRHVRYYNSIS